MTQYIEPNKHSDLKANGSNTGVLSWLKSLRSGLLEGFTVTAGTADFDINILSGRLTIDGTTIYDDETYLDSGILNAAISSTVGVDTHAMIYAEYTYQDVFPPAAMSLKAIIVQAASDPASPTLPANSIKLADIFIPAGETDLSNATIINAPKIPDRGASANDVLIERLVQSNLNTFFTGGGTMSYDSVADEFSWDADIDVFATVVTNKEKYLSAPLAVGQIASGGSPLTGVGDNAIIFTVFPRINVGDISTPTALTLRVLDLDSPTTAALNAFFDETTREQIVWLGMVIGGQLIMRQGLGVQLPAPAGSAPPALFLQHDPAGSTAHQWAAITEDLIVSILSISAFACTSSPAELGDIVDNPAFTATTTDDGGDGPTTAQLTNDDNLEDKDVVAGFSGTSNGTFQSDQTGYQKSGTGANGAVIFTLTADDGATPDVETVNLDWWRYTYWGFNATDPGAGNYDNTFLKTTITGQNGGSALRSGVGITINETPASAKYLFFAYPAWKGAPTSIIDNNTGFDVLSAFTEVDAAQAGITTENAAAIAENYRVYRSNALQSGNVNITVS